MKEKAFSIRAVLKEGWELTKVNIGFLVVYQIILFAIAYLFNVHDLTWKNIPIQILGFLILVLGKMGLYQSILLMTKGLKSGFDQFYKNWPQFISWVVASVIFAITFTIGLVFLIVPGLYFLARYGLFPFFILDKKLGPLEALAESGKVTKGITWHVFLLFLACFGLNILGLLLFGIGILISVPVTLFALAITYRILTGQTRTSILPKDVGADS